MADYQAVFAVGDALAKFLNNNYDQTVVGFPCTFKLVSSAEIANEDTTNLDKTVSHLPASHDHCRVLPQCELVSTTLPTTSRFFISICII